MAAAIHAFCRLMVVLILISATGCSMLKGRSSGASQEPPPLSLSITQGGLPEERPVEEVAEEQVIEEETSPEVEGTSVSRLQAGDAVVVALRGIYPKDEIIEDVIDEDGNLSLPHIGDVMAAGNSTAQLESEIRKLYIDGGYYRSITVNVITPQRSCYIRGEVQNPGRFPIAGGMTILQIVAAAGGYTEFASPRDVKLIRGGTTQEVNMRKLEKNPELDIRLEGGDVIVVGRSMF